MSDVRLAIIGTGGISRQHGRGIVDTDGVECTALCDADAERLAARNEQIGSGAALFSDWRAMLDTHGEAIDGVIICLPHHLHAAAVSDCIEAGKHVLCEKPLCTTLAAADALVDLVESASVCFMAAHNQLFNPFVNAIEERVESGAIGEIFYIRSQDCFVHPPILEDSWRANRQTQGGGELIDTGYHPSYLMMHLANAPVERVRCVMGRYRQSIEAEDTANMQIRFANGVIGEVVTSWAFARPFGTHSLHLIGAEGELFGTGNVLHHLKRGADTPERIELAKVHTFTEQVAHFARCVRGEAEPLHSIHESRAVLDLILRATEDADGWDAAET